MLFFSLALLVEWPLLVVALSLSAWALSAFTDAVRFDRLSGTRKGSDSGLYGFQYGTQVYAQQSTRTLTLTSPTLQTITTPTTYFVSLYPYALGTQAYSSIYASLGYVPPPVSEFSTVVGLVTDTYVKPAVTRTTTRSYPAWATEAIDAAKATAASATTAAASSTAAPTPSAAARRRDSSWATDGTLYRKASDTRSTLDVLLALFAVLVGAFAVRTIITPFAVILVARRSTRVRRHALAWFVGLTAFMFALIVGVGVAAFAVYGCFYDDALEHSTPSQVTLAFYALACLSTLFVLVVSSVTLHNVNKQGKTEKNG